MTAPVVISVLALLFTVASFWWLQAYRGRLSCFPVQTFSGYLDQHKAALRFPLCIYNSGAVPLVVTDLRLRLLPPVGEDVRMHFRTIRRSIRTDEDDWADFAHAYSVAGRSVDTRMVEFAMHESPAALLSGVPVDAVVEAQVGHSPAWRELGRFPVHVETMAHPQNYITYSNQQHVWPEGIVEEAAKAHQDLREKWGLGEPADP
jgi:hypothetical protein